MKVSGTSNFANINDWVNSPDYDLVSGAADSWQAANPDPSSMNASWEFVFRPGDFTGNHHLFNSGGNGAGLAFLLEGSTLRFVFQNANTADQRITLTTDLSAIGAATDFFHIVGTTDVETATTGIGQLWVNSTSVAGPTTSAGTINDWDGGDLASLGSGTEDHNIPTRAIYSSAAFTGDLAYFNFYGGEILDQADVDAAYAALITPGEPRTPRTWDSGLDLSLTKGSYTMPYRLYLPANYSEATKYPVMIFLHGSGARGTDNESQVNQHIRGLIERTESDYPAILIAPQCPPDKYWFLDPEDLTIDILEHVVRNYSTDVQRIYCTGLSMGGFGTTYHAYGYPHLFAAIAPMSGAYLSETLPENHRLRTLPTWLFHGSNDGAVDVEYSRDYYRFTTDISPIVFDQTLYGYTSALEGSIRYTELAGRGHNIWSLIYNHTDTDLYDWMFSKVRPAARSANTRIERSGNTLEIQAESNAPFAQAVLRGASDFESPLSDWESIGEDLFDAHGNATFTTLMDPDIQRYFYGVTTSQP